MKDYILAALSVFLSIIIVIVLVALGWYIVWKAFLSRFNFVRELLGSLNGNSPLTNQQETRSRPRKPRRD